MSLHQVFTPLQSRSIQETIDAIEHELAYYFLNRYFLCFAPLEVNGIDYVSDNEADLTVEFLVNDRYTMIFQLEQEECDFFSLREVRGDFPNKQCIEDAKGRCFFTDSFHCDVRALVATMENADADLSVVIDRNDWDIEHDLEGCYFSHHASKINDCANHRFYQAIRSDLYAQPFIEHPKERIVENEIVRVRRAEKWESYREYMYCTMNADEYNYCYNDDECHNGSGLFSDEDEFCEYRSAHFSERYAHTFQIPFIFHGQLLHLVFEPKRLFIKEFPDIEALRVSDLWKPLMKKVPMTGNMLN